MESTNSTEWANVPFSDSPYGYISNVNPLLYSPTNARFEENGFALFLLQAVVILVFCNVFGYAFQRLLGQPRVVGDLLAGVVIGPTALGNVPLFTSTVFPSVQRPELNLVAQIGLVVFLFLVGLETDTDLMLAHWHSVLLITVPPFALTFGVSVGIAHLFWQELTDGTQPFTTFFVFVGTVMAVTSLSVLSRILSEMGLLSTKMGAMSIAAGAGNDTLGYCLLAIASALAGGGQQIYALYQLLAFTAWLLILVFLWRPLLFRWLKAAGVNNMEANSHDHVPRLLIVAGVLGGLISSCVSDMVGLHTLVGAFFYGVAIPHGRYAVAITEAVETPVTLLLLPLYFGTVGLKIDFKTLNTGLVWGLIILLIFVIFLTKGSSTTICARLSGLSWRQAMCVGALMQSKGVIEVVIGAIALEAGVIDVQVFSALFLVFLATTSLVRPLARIIY
ncbi:Sodium/hydrogen exchanger, partial [Jaminaea rosea]